MVSEPDPDQCVSEDAELSKGGMLHPTSVVKGNEVFIIWGDGYLHLWTRFGRCSGDFGLKLAGPGEIRAGDTTGDYGLKVGRAKEDNIHNWFWGRYKWYQSQTRIGVSARTLSSPRGGGGCYIPHRL